MTDQDKPKMLRYVVYLHTNADSEIIRHLGRFNQRRRAAEMRRLMLAAIREEGKNKS